MRFIAITDPQMVQGEAESVVMMLDQGVDFVHIRKPQAACEQVAELLGAIPESFYSRLVLHDHFELFSRFCLGGVHLNRRNPTLPCGFEGRVSLSCHSLQQLRELDRGVEYAFLSPIFTSISKQGYQSAFTREQLLQAGQEGVINERVVALGGVTDRRIGELRDYGFGGVALLGYLWGCQATEMGQRVRRVRELLDGNL